MQLSCGPLFFHKEKEAININHILPYQRTEIQSKQPQKVVMKYFGIFLAAFAGECRIVWPSAVSCQRLIDAILCCEPANQARTMLTTSRFLFGTTSSHDLVCSLFFVHIAAGSIPGGAVFAEGVGVVDQVERVEGSQVS